MLTRDCCESLSVLATSHLPRPTATPCGHGALRLYALWPRPLGHVFAVTAPHVTRPQPHRQSKGKHEVIAVDIPLA